MASRQSGSTPLRTDIQGLRAVAVGIVVVYHLHAAALPGGFVGVDVFLVISGFLITSHLISRPPSTPGQLADFWGRRVRRLLPASLLVLAVTLAAVRLIAPETIWENNARDARAAALYFVNWALADRAVDYLGAAEVPSAVQHFWSLSVEEQFYFGWPLLVAAVFLLTRGRPRMTRPALGAVFGLVTTGSLAWSIHLTSANPAAAYFVTTTRIWELAAGGLLAVVVTRSDHGDADRDRPGKRALRDHQVPRPARALGSWAGIAMIVVAATTFDASTPFPGYHAVLPVLGAVLVIGCRAPRENHLSPGPLLGLRPMQWLGNVSYSVYLWHWPLIIVTTVSRDHPIGPRTAVALLALTLVLAGLTERFVERPFRTRSASRSLPRTFTVGIAAMASILVAATVQLGEVQNRQDESRAEIAAALEAGGPCLGAAALTPNSDCPEVPYDSLVPSAAAAKDDKSESYHDVGPRSCWSGPPTFPQITCEFGDTSSEVTIALFGNSHAGHWLPALQPIAEQHDWRIQTHLASACVSGEVRIEFSSAGADRACVDWVRTVTDRLVEEKPDLVVISNRLQSPAVGFSTEDSEEPYAEGYERTLRKLTDAGITVLAIRDTPAGTKDVPDCIAAHPRNYQRCDGTREERRTPDPVIDAIAALGSPLVHLADLTDRLCTPQICHVVNGGVITYFDRDHMTATYATTLAPYLEPFVIKAISAGRG